MKKVVAVLGSPRRGGNSETIADKILDTAKSLGAQTTKFALNELSFRGCQACMGCKTGSETCVVNDDLAKVLDAVRESDAFIMTSPIYFGEVTGQLKSAIDRMYSFLGPDYMTNPNPGRLAPGKNCVFVLTQGNPDEKAFDVFQNYGRFFKRFGCETHVVRGLGLRAKTAAAAKPELMREAEDLAKALMQ